MIEYLDSVCDDQIDEKEVRGIFATLDVTGDRTIDLWEFEVTKREKSSHRVMTIITLSVGDGANEKRWLEESKKETSEEWQHLY